MTQFKKVPVGSKRQEIVLVPREQLRTHGAPRFQRRSGVHVTAPLPVRFPMDFSKNRSVSFPILDNSRYGDCYLVAVLHWIQAWTGLRGPEWQPDIQKVVSHYLELSGGDNGLSDGQIYPDWKLGELPPERDHKLLDYATLDVHDDVAINESMFACCGLIWTAALEDSWLNNTSPGSVWDAGGRPDPAAGHAMYLSGTGAEAGNLVVETWAISPPIQVTRRGMREADPELIVCVSLDAFGPDGKTYTGMTYQQVADWWFARTGRQLPPYPGPGPGPTPAPSWLCPVLGTVDSMLEQMLANTPILKAIAHWLYLHLATSLGCAVQRGERKAIAVGDAGRLQQQFDSAMDAAITQAGADTLTGLFLLAIKGYVDGLFAPPPPPPPPQAART